MPQIRFQRSKDSNRGVACVSSWQPLGEEEAQVLDRVTEEHMPQQQETPDVQKFVAFARM